MTAADNASRADDEAHAGECPATPSKETAELLQFRASAPPLADRDASAPFGDRELMGLSQAFLNAEGLTPCRDERHHRLQSLLMLVRDRRGRPDAQPLDEATIETRGFRLALAKIEAELSALRRTGRENEGNDRGWNAALSQVRLWVDRHTRLGGPDAQPRTPGCEVCVVCQRERDFVDGYTNPTGDSWVCSKYCLQDIIEKQASPKASPETLGITTGYMAPEQSVTPCPDCGTIDRSIVRTSRLGHCHDRDACAQRWAAVFLSGMQSPIASNMDPLKGGGVRAWLAHAFSEGLRRRESPQCPACGGRNTTVAYEASLGEFTKCADCTEEVMLKGSEPGKRSERRISKADK